ncbi:MAG: helix-turn-helix domain-containing protein [Candidatus Korobacteraceae bacterium]
MDDLAKTAERDPRDAAQLLEDALSQNQASPDGVKNDWPDLLAEALEQDSDLAIGQWAHSNHLAQQTVSRGFFAAYGVAPEVFRAESRARAAWLRLIRGSDCLCQIAVESGFADQAHMTRWIHRITGAPPGAWRKVCVPPLASRQRA